MTQQQPSSGGTGPQSHIAIEVRPPIGFDEAVAACRTALASEGFGVLTEIDLAATLTAKLGGEHAPYLILGACHPPSAQQLTAAVPAFGVLLPCNVTVSVEDDTTVVRAMDPAAVVAATLRGAGTVGDDTIAIVETIADDIAGRLRAALRTLPT
jgi:uncharacterized protein (DUF302 family)